MLNTLITFSFRAMPLSSDTPQHADTIESLIQGQIIQSFCKNPYQTVQTAAFTSFSHCVFQTIGRTGKKHPAAPGKFSSPGEKSGRSCDPQARQRAQCYELCVNQGGVDPTPTPKPREVPATRVRCHARCWKCNVAQGDGGHTRRGDTGEVCTHVTCKLLAPELTS